MNLSELQKEVEKDYIAERDNSPSTDDDESKYFDILVGCSIEAIDKLTDQELINIFSEAIAQKSDIISLIIAPNELESLKAKDLMKEVIYDYISHSLPL